VPDQKIWRIDFVENLQQLIPDFFMQLRDFEVQGVFEIESKH
jgi:hypothetical protein